MRNLEVNTIFSIWNLDLRLWTLGYLDESNLVTLLLHMYQNHVKLLTLFSLTWSDYDPSEKVRQRMMNKHCIIMRPIPNS